MKQRMRSTLLVLFLTLLLANGISAQQDQIPISIELEKGWNLVAFGLLAANVVSTSQIKFPDIKAIIYYSTLQKKYITMPGFGFESELEVIAIQREKELSGGDDRQLISKAAWVYSAKKGRLDFETDDVPILRDRKLYRGWNFVSVGPEFTDRKFQEIFAKCTVEKAYHYNNKVYAGHAQPSYEKIYPETSFVQKNVGMGIVVKITESCAMEAGEAATLPPALPPG